MLPSLLDWFNQVRIAHSDAVALVAGGEEGYSGLALAVKATRDIAEGEGLCTIPKAACLSIRTTQLADIIEEEELGGGLGLVLAVLHEMSLGEESTWHGYFRALPPREYLPLFWSDAQLKWLQGTELEGRVAADRAAAAEDFEDHVLPLLQKYPGRLRDDFITLGNFHVAASFVASRAFGVDEWHGDAMVPLADIFNHKASVVELGEGYEVHGAGTDSSDGEGGGSDEEPEGGGSDGEGEGGGSEEGGSSGTEGEEASEGEEGSSSSSSDEEHPSQRGKQAAGHGHEHRRDGACCGGALSHAHGDGTRAHTHAAAASTAAAAAEQASGGGEHATVLPSVMGGGPAAIHGLESANGLHLRLQMGIVDADEDTLEIVAGSAVPAGAEVHNTYGELGNAELVKKYGFALRQNPFTLATLDKGRLLGAAKRALGAKRWRVRSALLERETEVLEAEEEPFEALPNGHISAPLFVALLVLGASDNEAARWEGVADALRPPAAAAAAAGGDSEEEEEEEQQQLGAVQVWPVLDTKGKQLTPEAASAAAAAQPRSRGAQLTPAMCRLLRDEVQQRMAAYPAPLQQDVEKLAAAEEQQQQPGAAAAADSEAAVAERAALLLRITEQEVLRDLLAALAARLAAAGGEAAGANGGATAAGTTRGKRKR
ncbi:SET domain-containing [Micractinium conductrix]|uniref:SET domain-containing n=1 Tax=Micractinium conductrix TaxID=554055 RepID=A0A2P6V799_9CHLO|nr:SET domain-containing [Micractinium conductrix]|eukprot:PSC69948.1 SET domain-containing [Micractinium conductrix]